jgi:hypothetical protein
MLADIQKSDTTQASLLATNADELVLARLLFNHIENQIKMADSKAWLTIAANSLLVAIGNYLTSGLIEKMPSDLIIGTIGMVVLVIIVSLWYALMAVNPSLIATDTNNLFYFGNIAKLSEQEFVSTFKVQTPEQVSCALFIEVYNKAVIAEKKFKSLKVSLNFFFFAMILGSLSLFVYIYLLGSG